MEFNKKNGCLFSIREEPDSKIIRYPLKKKKKKRHQKALFFSMDPYTTDATGKECTITGRFSLVWLKKNKKKTSVTHMTGHP